MKKHSGLVHKKTKPQDFEFDKYALYRRAVQAPDVDVEFLAEAYRELRGGQKPVSMREDFCGTFALSCAWVQMGSRQKAIGVDLDVEPIDYGKQHYLSAMSAQQQKRLQIINENVLDVRAPQVDIIAAMNFSFFIFKQRDLLWQYFRKCREGLRKNGLLIVDSFGGTLCTEANIESVRLRGFTYYWEQESFDPVTNEALFHIHLRPKGRRSVARKVFSYDWRLWSIPEIRDVMSDAGFQRTHVYWEGTTRSGDGDGHFRRVDQGEPCEAWVAYVVGEK